MATKQAVPCRPLANEEAAQLFATVGAAAAQSPSNAADRGR